MICAVYSVFDLAVAVPPGSAGDAEAARHHRVSSPVCSSPSSIATITIPRFKAN